MKLLTHNMLACHIRGVKNNFPFSIEVIKTEVVDADFNPGLLIRVIPVWRAPCILDFGSPLTRLHGWFTDFLRHIFPRIIWPAFLQGATQV